jgi:hypothetical protein
MNMRQLLKWLHEFWRGSSPRKSTVHREEDAIVIEIDLLLFGATAAFLILGYIIFFQ